MISFEDALAAVLSQARRLPTENIPLHAAAGRVLAGPVTADLDAPPFDAAAMDGWAVRLSDLPAEGTVLKVAGALGAGGVFTGPLMAGSTLKVMTGAAVPEGTEAVVAVEESEEAGPGLVRLLEVPLKGRHLRRRGEVFRTGTRLLESGRRLTPADASLAAAAGRATLEVSRQPRAAVLVTGDEVVDAGQRPGPGQIRNTNGPLLLASLARAGALATDLGICPDDRGALQKMLGMAVESDFDLVLSTGGVSAGDFDLVTETLPAVGCRTVFHRVAVRPAKPLLFATRAGTLVFGLPGNPVSAAVAFDLFVLPALRAMQGLAPPAPGAVEAFLAEPVRNRGSRLAFVPGRVLFDEGRLVATPIGNRGSHDLAAHAASTAYLILPPNVDLAAGERVLVRLGEEGTTLG